MFKPLTELSFCLYNASALKEVSFPELFQVREELYGYASLHFVGKLNRVSIFRDNVSGFFHVFLGSGFHALNSYFFIYKGFGKSVSFGEREVFWASSA